MIKFQTCQDNPEIIDKESTCMTNDELEEWVEEVKPKIGMVYSFSFIDFESSDEAFQHRASNSVTEYLD